MDFDSEAHKEFFLKFIFNSDSLVIPIKMAGQVAEIYCAVKEATVRGKKEGDFKEPGN